jgi:hypothetical protein
MPRLAPVVAVGRSGSKSLSRSTTANHGTARDSTDRLSSFLPHKGEFVDSTDNTRIGFQHCRDKATRLSNKCVPRPYSHLAGGV